MRLSGSVAEACVQQWLEEINALFPQTPSAHSSSETQSTLLAQAEDSSVASHWHRADGREGEGMAGAARAAKGQLTVARELADHRWADPDSELFRDQVDSLKRAIRYTQRDLFRSKREIRSRSRSRSQPSQHMRQLVGSASCNLEVQPPQQPPQQLSLVDAGQNLNGAMPFDTSGEPALAPLADRAAAAGMTASSICRVAGIL